MKVLLKCRVDKDDATYGPGDEVDLEDGLAVMLVDRGDAEPVRARKGQKEPPPPSTEGSGAGLTPETKPGEGGRDGA